MKSRVCLKYLVIDCRFYSYPKGMEHAYITDRWGELRVKNATLSICAPIRHLLLFFIKKVLFLSFSFPFLLKYQIFATEY